MLPINNTDFSATLIKAKAYKPNVLLNNMGGLTQINCMKQFTQFGMQKEMALGGALFELESIKACPPEAQAGWWDMEWWWNQPNVPEVVKFVADYRAATKKTPSARDWFGYVSVHSVRLAAEKAKSLDGPKLAAALEDLELPPDVALQPGKVRYRKGDHELMPNIFVGEVHPPKGESRRRVHGRGAGAGRTGRRHGRRDRLQDGRAELIHLRVIVSEARQSTINLGDYGSPCRFAPIVMYAQRAADDASHPVQRHQRADHRRLLRADGARSFAHPQSVERHQLRAR